MIKIYHNPRCSKSREGLALLEKSGQDFEVIKYLEDIPTKKELNEIIKLLGIKPVKLIRRNESIWKEKFAGKSLSDAKIVAIMVEHPKLIERPIVIKGKKAVLGRPTNNIQILLD